MSGNVIHLNDHRATPVINDGGKARIQERRKRLGLCEPFRGEDSDSLVMLRADETQSPCDCA